MSDFSRELTDLEGRLQRVRAAAGDAQIAAEVAVDLEVAYEELRVADEELRAQQEEVARLLERDNLLRWQHERMLTMLPVPAVLTDGSGVIQSVNAAAAAPRPAACSNARRLIGTVPTPPYLDAIAASQLPNRSQRAL